MNLKEFEGLDLLEQYGILSPKRKIFSKEEIVDLSIFISDKLVIKAQTLTKKRSKSGFVKILPKEEVEKEISSMIGKNFKGEKIEQVLVEEYIPHNHEYYLSFIFDSLSKSPVLIISKEGGIDIEEINEIKSRNITILPINPLEGISLNEAKLIAKKAGFAEEDIISRFIISAYSCFTSSDSVMLEINPFIIHKDKILALDANIHLDDSALIRHKFNFPDRIGSREASEREKAARDIDREDHHGTAGKTYIDLEGDIAVLASGGGASLTVMDALISYGGKPANYTEYSGNPPAEKVEKLTKITLSKENLSGCFVIGGTANFTDIYETLKGFLNGLNSIHPKPRYPIVIRRAGPRDKEAYDMVKRYADENKLDIHLFDENTPLTYPAKIIVELSKRYKEKNGHIN